MQKKKSEFEKLNGLREMKEFVKKSKRKSIFLVSRCGPEWYDPVKAFTTRKSAKAFAKKTPVCNKDGLGRFSSHVVEEVPLDV